ncbi:MAG: RNA 2'-phosphotransferase [Hyphomonadaceae bacterium]
MDLDELRGYRSKMALTPPTVDALTAPRGYPVPPSTSRDKYEPMTSDTEISKTLSYWLRHKPEAAGFKLSSEGWADVDRVLAALSKAEMAADWDRLLHVVETNDKSRFELSSDGARIRARQGHSVKVEADWTPATPPVELFHGTIARFWTAIETEGLKAMKRHHVHLSADVETAKRVAMRRGQPIILTVDAAGLAAAGEPFLLASNGVWLVSSVPPKFLSRLP